MEDIIKEETQDNLAEEETAIEETQEEIPTEETETPIKETKSQEYSDREKRLYARTKKAEEEVKRAREELAKAKVPISDIDAILEVQSSTKDLDPQEIAELKLRATAGQISLTEARKDPNYLLWQTAYREKVEKDNAAKPSTLQPEVERKKSFIDKLKEAESTATVTVQGEKYVPGTSHLDAIEKKAELLEKQGLWKNPRRRDASRKIPLSQN